MEFQRGTASPVCEEILGRIAALSRIEAMVRGHPPEHRLKVRQELSTPIVEALRPWVEAQLGRLSSASELARHIRYALKRSNGLSRLFHDRRIEMDTIPVGNLIRLVKLTKENALFADSDDSAKTWARCASLTDTLSRIVDMHSMSLVSG